MGSQNDFNIENEFERLQETNRNIRNEKNEYKSQILENEWLIESLKKENQTLLTDLEQNYKTNHEKLNENQQLNIKNNELKEYIIKLEEKIQELSIDKENNENEVKENEIEWQSTVKEVSKIQKFLQVENLNLQKKLSDVTQVNNKAKHESKKDFKNNLDILENKFKSLIKFIKQKRYRELYLEKELKTKNKEIEEEKEKTQVKDKFLSELKVLLRKVRADYFEECDKNEKLIKYAKKIKREKKILEMYSNEKYKTKENKLKNL